MKKNKVFLCKDKKKQKGQLHCHSTRSDGVLSHIEVMEKYRSHGYNFILMSDHRIYWDDSEYNTDEFIVLKGCEIDMNTGGYPAQDYHFQCIAYNEANIEKPLKHNEIYASFQYNKEDSIQNMIDDAKKRGNIVILNHPSWSRNRYDILNLKGFFALEIYNHCSEIEECCGFATDYWDEALRNNIKIFGVATDDTHNYNEKIGSKNDFNGGWVQVESDNLYHDEIVTNLLSGNFYSSMGPEIYDLRLENGVITIQCSAVKKINFKTSSMRGTVIYPEYGTEIITEGCYQIKEQDKWVRVECIDKFGKIAWSNPIFLGGLDD